MTDFEERLDELEKRVSNLEKIFEKNDAELEGNDISTLEKNISAKMDKLKIPKLVILSFKINSIQTLDEIKQILKGWGVSNIEKWIGHGHYSDYILKKGLKQICILFVVRFLNICKKIITILF